MKNLFLCLCLLSFCMHPLFAKEKKETKENKLNKKETIVAIETNQGVIKIKLFPEIAPKTCENFLTLANKHYYDGIIFHRVIKDFMLQTGDPTGTGRGGQSCWGTPFADEVKKDVTFSKPGIVAMANAGPNTNGSQFFITTVKTPWLNMHHTIFGEVIEGYDVVKKIEAVQTDNLDKPYEVQKMVKVSVISE